MYYNYCEPGEWDHVKPGWFEHVISIDDLDLLVKLSTDIVEWLHASIDNCKRHARWNLDLFNFKIKFRYERDFLLFLLRWA